MKYKNVKATPTELGQIIKSLVLMGKPNITTKEIEKNLYDITIREA